jgi:hypothetical protein
MSIQRKVVLKHRIIQVVIEEGYAPVIQKCQECDNFDEHGADWELPLDSKIELVALITLLNEALKYMEDTTENE